MIYWLTGQPGSGKTVIGKKMKEYFDDSFHIDGDDLRELFSNKDYSIKGRVENVGTAQRIAHYLHNQGKTVIVSLVSPYIDQREEFKALMGENLVEIYVHTDEKRGREKFFAKAYIAPKKNFIDIDTTKDNPHASFAKILLTLQDD